MAELQEILIATREQEHDRQRFAASLKGIDIDKDSGSQEARFEEVKRRAEAEIRGLNKEQIEFEEIGISYEEE